MNEGRGGSLALPALCVVTDRRLCGEDRLPSVVAAAVDGGATMVQLREKDASAAHLYWLGERLRDEVRGRCLLVINDRADVALALGADGVQLGAGSLSVEAMRRTFGRALLIGRSVHGVAEAIAAERDGADYLIVGTMFASRSHPGSAPAGPDLLQAVRAAVQLPLIAIGGIDRTNVGTVMAAGADGVAIISAIVAAADPGAAAAELYAAVREGWRRQRSNT